MALLKFKPNFDISSSLVFGSLLGLALTALNIGVSFLEKKISLQPLIVDGKSGTLAATSNILQLPSGSYFLSAGRPRANCDVFLDSTKISSNKSSIYGLRGSLNLDASFNKSPIENYHLLKIICENEQGFPPGFTNLPLIFSSRWGVFIQARRWTEEVLLGPLACLLFLLIISSESLGRIKMNQTRKRYLLFSISSLMYAISLAHWPRLFIPSLQATVLHIELRTLFSASFFFLLAGRQSKFSYVVTFAHALHALVTIYLGTTRPSDVSNFYKLFLPIYAITTALSIWIMSTISPLTKANVLLRYVAIVWFVLQCSDLLVEYSILFLPYKAPIVLALIVTALSLIRRQELLRSEQIESAVSDILRQVQSNLLIDDKVKNISAIVLSNTTFTRVSAYVDAFTLGKYDNPTEKFMRIWEAGYVKDTDSDMEIDFSDGRGVHMQNALFSGSIDLRKGKTDGAWFISIPIGKHACINLSNPTESNPIQANEGLALIRRMYPAISSIGDQLVESGARASFALEQLRTRIGDGEWPMPIGAIFLDINNYSDAVKRFGDSYARFVATKYLPALCQAVRPWAVKEASNGDDLYLVCINELMSHSCTIDEAVYSTIQAILEFARLDGATFCRMQGYPPIRLQIGANAGDATVVCDRHRVRTVGDTVINASRLQKAAPPGGVLVHESLAAAWTKDGPLAIGVVETDRVKLTTVKGCRVSLKLQSHDAA